MFDLIVKTVTNLKRRISMSVAFLNKRRSGAVCTLSLRERQWRSMQKSYAYMNYDDERVARKAIEMIDDYTMCSYRRLVTLWQQVRYLDNVGVEGCLVECGTWRGGACGLMALAHLRSGKARRSIHLFDSFQGLPEPSFEFDNVQSLQIRRNRMSGQMLPIGRCVGTLADNQRLMRDVVNYPQELIVYHTGWFRDTVPIAGKTIGNIALLRLDGDWYESTKTCLEHLYPLIRTGGFLVIDDYGRFEGCRRAVHDYFTSRGIYPFFHHIDETGRYVLVP